MLNGWPAREVDARQTFSHSLLPCSKRRRLRAGPVVRRRSSLHLIHVKANTAGSPHRQVLLISWKMVMKTSAQLQLDVIAELKWEPSVNAGQVGV